MVQGVQQHGAREQRLAALLAEPQAGADVGLEVAVHRASVWGSATRPWARAQHLSISLIVTDKRGESSIGLAVVNTAPSLYLEAPIRDLEAPSALAYG